MPEWIHQSKTLSLIPLLGFWLLLNYVVIISPPEVFQQPTPFALNEVRVQAAADPTPQRLKPSLWQVVDLPHDWSTNEDEQDQYWYRSQVTLSPQQADTWAVYIPMVTHNAALYINGVWVDQAGGFDAPVSRHHNEPLLFSFSSALLRNGSNVIELRVKASYFKQGFLSQVYLAPQSELKPYWQYKHFVRLQLIEWVTVVMFVLSLVVLIFWVARPQDKIYGIFALELFFWAMHNLNLFVSEIPVPARIWEAMTMSTLGWTVITMIFFNHRFVGEQRRWVENVLLVFAVLGCLLFLLPDIGLILKLGYGLWDSFLLFFGCYAIYHLAMAYWHNPQKDIYLMMLVGIPILVFGFHDILLVNHFIEREQGLIIQYSVIPAVLLFSWFMLRRFVYSINQAEDLAQNLEQRVLENKQQIHQQYEQLKVMEHQQLLSDERERIMRDMHDGVGGQLITVLNLLQEQQGEVFRAASESVNRSLVDLHFVIDSLDPVQYELPTLLGTMRMRLSDQICAAGIQLEWAVTDLPEVPDMTPTRCLHILRIVQEAITNVIKHSNSALLKVATGVIENEYVYIDVIDQGEGMSENGNTGHGMKNMEFRARQIGGKLEVHSAHDGTRVRLQIALA